jgi:hypothetical protein
VACAEKFPGRDPDYLNLNVTYASNVVKFGMIISWFPKPFKLCAVTSTHVTMSLNTLQRCFTHVIKPSLSDTTRNRLYQTHG